MRGEEKWRWDGTGAPEGRLGEGRGFHTLRGKFRDHWEGRGSEGSVVSFPLPTWTPKSLLRPGLDPLPTETPSSRAGPEGVGGREGGAKIKYRPTGPAPLRGGWGRGGVPTPSGTHPWLGVQWGWGRPLAGGHGGTEGNAASTCPVHLGTREPVGLPGLILCPQSLPPTKQSPNPTPTLPPRALPLHLETPSETPSTELDLNHTHTPSPRALPPNSGTPHSGGPPLEVLPLPFRTQVLSRGPVPRLNVTPHSPRFCPTLNSAPA